MGKYNFPLDMDSDDTNPKLIQHIFPGAEVLEFGAANGRMTKYLSENMQCKVDIVEIDEEAGREAREYARTACIGLEEGDVEKDIWEKKLASRKYDFIVFADVLEHLFNPADVLKRCKKNLKENAKILVSIPNIANNAIIYQLLNDDFDYKETGLLDRTHIHFFTMKTFRNMVIDMGLYIVAEDAVCRQIDETEFGIQIGSMPEIYREILGQHKSGLVYQGIFVLALKPDSDYSEMSCSNFDNDLFLTKLYYRTDSEQDFLEEHCIICRRNINMQQVEFELNCVVADVRLDPVSIPGFIKINRLTVYNENHEIIPNISYVTNGRYMGDGIYAFPVSEPQILISGINCNVKKIEIDYKCLKTTVEDMSCVVATIDKNDEKKIEIINQKQQLELEIKNLNTENRKLLSEIEDVKTSFLGKIYYKLKKLKMILSKKDYYHK